MKLNDAEFDTAPEDLQRACFKLESYLIDRILFAMPLELRKTFLNYTVGYDYSYCKPAILDDDIILKFHFGTPQKGNITVSYRLKQISKLFDAIVQDGIEQLKAAGIIELEDKA